MMFLVLTCYWNHGNWNRFPELFYFPLLLTVVVMGYTWVFCSRENSCLRLRLKAPAYFCNIMMEKLYVVEIYFN